jgi:hypothetical protein
LYNNEVDRLSRKFQEVIGLDIPSSMLLPMEEDVDEDVEKCADALLPNGML